MSEERICVECKTRGTENISRCGHILHVNCLRNMNYSSCRKCGIALSRDIEVEKVFVNIFALGLDKPEAKELEICLESFMNKERQYEIIPYNSEILSNLQKFGWNINHEKFGGPKLFYKACEFDDLLKVNLLIEFGIDLNKYGPKGLLIAHSSFDTFDRLVKLGVKLKDEIIFDVIAKNNTRMLQRLMQEGINLNVKRSNGIRPIHAAAEAGSIRMFNVLIKNGADITSKDKENNSILHYACLSGNGLDLVNFLIESGYDLEVQNTRKETPLNFAIINQKQSAAKLLIEKGAKIDSLDDNGNTYLHLSISKSLSELLPLLINKGADVNAKNHKGKTPLHVVPNYSPKCVNLLLDNGADVNILDKSGNSPLYYIYSNLKEDSIKKLAVKGANFNIKNEYDQNIRDLIWKRYPDLKI